MILFVRIFINFIKLIYKIETFLLLFFHLDILFWMRVNDKLLYLYRSFEETVLKRVCLSMMY